jgi:hypothetical protein
MGQNSIVSRAGFEQALMKSPGMTYEGAQEFCEHYERASMAAQRVLPKVRELGFFSSSSERIEAFLAVCCALDSCVHDELISETEAHIALFVLLYSSSDFEKAMKAFVNFAHGKNLGGRHLPSVTAAAFAQTC